MTAPVAAPPEATDALTPVRHALWEMSLRANVPPMTGLFPGLTVTDRRGWRPASSLVKGTTLDDLLDTAKQRWRATPHAAAALAWKCYSYWVALPAVIGFAAARRVPLVRPQHVVVQWSTAQPFARVGLTAVEVAVLPSDPLALELGTAAARRAARVRVVADDDALIAAMRSSLVDDHLSPMLAQIRQRLHLGPRILWGSLASGIAHGLSRAADIVPGSTLDTANQLLTGLDLDDLVDLAPRAGGRAGLSVQRKTCCLAFTLPEPKICSGCCIR
jgi:hypothetical protein